MSSPQVTMNGEHYAVIEIQPGIFALVTSEYADIDADQRIDQIFSVNGDGTGSTDMNTATPATFKITCPAATVMKLRRVNFHLMDAGIRLNRFGGIAALTNGITITQNDSDDAVLHTFTPHLIHKLADFGLLAGPDVPIIADIADDSWICRWTLQKAGKDVKLTAGQYMAIVITDALDEVTEFHAQAQGWKYDA